LDSFMVVDGAVDQVNHKLNVLLYKDSMVPQSGDAGVVVYTIRDISFKGATVCLGYRMYYTEEARRSLVALVPPEFRDTVDAVSMSVDEFLSVKNGYYVGGLVFLESDDAGRLYVHDPDTDGRVYLPALVAYYPKAFYNFEMIPMDQIRLSDELSYRDAYDVDDLADSIKRFGLLNPLVVYRDKKAYRLVAGYRRYHALRALGWTHAPSVVLNMPSETQNLVPLIENFFRLQPTKKEYRRLINYIISGYGGYSSIYDLLRALNVKDKKTVLRLLRDAGLDSEVQVPMEARGQRDEEKSAPFMRLVDQLMGEAAQPSWASDYDPEAIRLRIEALSATQGDTQLPEDDASNIDIQEESVGEQDGDSVGLIELPVDLLRKLSAYLKAEDADSFKRKLICLLEHIVDSQVLVLLREQDNQLLSQVRSMETGGDAHVMVLEPWKL
jgi:ParB/RepB/Spo0J family partition protein